MNYLNFSLSNEDDGTGKLTLEVEYEAFKGTGDCHVDISQLKSTAEKFGSYPLAPGAPVAVEGGYFHDDMSGLKQIHLHLSASSRGNTGAIALRIIVASPVDDASPYAATLTCELPATYEHLDQISRGLSSLATQRSTEFRVCF